MDLKQADCFKLNVAYWKFLGIWPGEEYSHYYYSKIFVAFFVITYDVLLTINFYFMPRQLDLFIAEMLFYFTEMSILSKVLTFLFLRDKIENILIFLDSDIFQPDADDTLKIVEKAKEFIKTYWKMVAVVCYAANAFHVIPPIITHLFLHNKLELPVCSYSFLPEDIKNMLIYPIYFYQSIGIHFHMLYNVTIDTFLNGLLILAIAQLEVLDHKLRHLTAYVKSDIRDGPDNHNVLDPEYVFKSKLTKCISHFTELEKFCSLIEKVFSMALFIQVAMSSCIICMSMIRFLMPTTSMYYFFLATYTTAIVAEILVPCWFGSILMEKSSSLSLAVYYCDWMQRGRPFKSNMRLFVERMNKPLSITGCKIFPLSLTTFTKIMNTAYSFFTLLRHMQTRES